jgi:hypothetical protein
MSSTGPISDNEAPPSGPQDKTEVDLQAAHDSLFEAFKRLAPLVLEGHSRFVENAADRILEARAWVDLAIAEQEEE